LEDYRLLKMMEITRTWWLWYYK